MLLQARLIVVQQSLALVFNQAANTIHEQSHGQQSFSHQVDHRARPARGRIGNRLGARPLRSL